MSDNPFLKKKGRMRITVHPLFLLFGVWFAFTGKLFLFLSATVVALIHEYGHALAAARVGYGLDRIVLMPYGALISGDLEGVGLKDEIFIALAGPLINAACAVLFVALWWFFPDTYPYTDVAVYSSASIAVINLLPAYPLDGGRVAKCVLSRIFGGKCADIILRVLNVLLACGLVVCFAVGGFNVTFLLFALLLLCSAVQKSPPAVRINFASRAALRRGVEVKTVLVDGSLNCKDAIRLLDDKRYLVLRNVDDGREITQDELYAVLSEKGVYDCVFT